MQVSLDLGVAFKLQRKQSGRRSVVYTDTASAPGWMAQGTWSDITRFLNTSGYVNVDGTIGGIYTAETPGADRLELTVSRKNARFAWGTAAITFHPSMDNLWISVASTSSDYAGKISKTSPVIGHPNVSGDTSGTGTFLWLKKAHWLEVTIDTTSTGVTVLENSPGTIRLKLDMHGRF
jgi:hypothetical protein